MDFKEKVIWITGASSGIGEHLAYAFADAGAKLVLSSRNEKELNRVRQNCHGDASVRVLPMDITHFDGLPAAVEKAVKAFGFINVLVHNAGVSQRASAAQTNLEVDRLILDTNYLGPVALTKAALPLMSRQQFGHIVVISSVLGKYAVPNRSAYCASKHALHGFFDSLRHEVRRDNIKITLICPGYVNTNLSLNALRGDGSLHNRPPKPGREGIDPVSFAQKALRAIRNGYEEVYIGKKEALAVYVKRFFPGLFARLVRGMDDIE